MKDTGILIGRILLSAIFVVALIGKLADFPGTVERMDDVGMPAPNAMLVGAILMLLLGALSVILGLRVRIGVGVLIVFLLVATYFFHNPLDYSGTDQRLQLIQLLKNMGLAGGLLILASVGPGSFALDRKIGGGGSKKKAG